MANTIFGVSIAGVLFGTFCYRQRAFRHDSSWPVRISGAPCHRQYGFSTLFVISGTLFRVLSADRVDF
jgi:hypothetical protein